ncbi:hypothetical protein V6O07_07560, partial [Arthrospira platensis SPKY2]
MTDGSLSSEELGLETVDALKVLEPFGRGFEAPLFEGRFKILAVRPMGDGTHLRLKMQLGQRIAEGVWFRALKQPGEPLPVRPDSVARVVFE